MVQAAHAAYLHLLQKVGQSESSAGIMPNADVSSWAWARAKEEAKSDNEIKQNSSVNP
jgi:hypothetical protein